jgi:hypothetical protein
MRGLCCLVFAAATLTGCGPKAPDPAGTSAAKEPAEPVAPNNPEAVRAVFVGYKSAILNSRGDEAISYLARPTIDQYEKYRILALTAPEDELRGEGFMTRMQVLMLRQRVPLEKLEAMDGHALLVHAVNEGWIGKNSVSGVELGEVQINENFAAAGVLLAGAPSPQVFQFMGEEGTWKLDLLFTLKAAEPALRQKAKEAGMEEDQMILLLLETVSGRRADPNIWKPLRP